MLALIVAGALVLACSSARCGPRSGRPGAAAVDERCSATAPPTSAWSPRTPSGCCSWASRSWSSAYLQVVRGYDAIETGVIFTAATVGLLVSSLAAERLAKRRRAADPDPGRLRDHHRRHRRSCSAMVTGSPSAWAFAPGLLLIGLGLGLMLTPRSTSCSPASRRSSRARSPACRAASPTSARPSAPPSPAPSWSPASPRPRARLRAGDDRPRRGRPGRARSLAPAAPDPRPSRRPRPHAMTSAGTSGQHR